MKYYNLGLRQRRPEPRSRHWFFHRWSYSTFLIHRVSEPDVLTSVVVRYCYRCGRLEGDDLPGGEAYTWDDYYACAFPENLGEWAWPLAEEVVKTFKQQRR